MNVVVFVGRDVHPSATRESAEDACKKQKARYAGRLIAVEVILKRDQSQSGACETVTTERSASFRSCDS